MCYTPTMSGTRIINWKLFSVKVFPMCNERKVNTQNIFYVCKVQWRIFVHGQCVLKILMQCPVDNFHTLSICTKKFEHEDSLSEKFRLLNILKVRYSLVLTQEEITAVRQQTCSHD